MRHKTGFTLIETMVALAIFAAASSAVIMMFLQAFSLNNAAKLRSQAAVYAQQGLEQVRSFYQTEGWVALSAKNYTCPETINPIFTRCITRATNASQVAITITSKVSWNERGQTKNIEYSTYFYSY